ncbi:MAG: type II secretion system GspH family protein [Burkholderiales bacterium]|jgi:prepilin-type N-terminal cleavage/methylation domain-containing protein|nr:type II secretion system GspH family protein [Burkholderiales bacterium]
MFILEQIKSGRGISKKNGGFSLIELSIVLIVIGLILGAISIGKDVHRNAVHQRIASEFIQGWLLAYDSYVAGVGVVPADNVSAPTGCVNRSCATNASGNELCDKTLRDTMLAAGIGLPAGRAEGREDRYVYLDSNGSPHDLKVCFQNVKWTEAGSSSGNYVERSRNVMVITGMTPGLADFIDHYFDTVVDARFGNVREDVYANSVSGNKQPWSMDETYNFAGTSRSYDEDQSAELIAYMRMHR